MRWKAIVVAVLTTVANRGRIVLLVGILVAAAPVALVAQDEPSDHFAKWVGEWEYNQGEGGHSCEMLGELIVHCEGHFTDGAGNTNGYLFVARYDSNDEVYRNNRFYRNGYADDGIGWVEGDTWTFVFEGRAGARFRQTLTMDDDGNTWTYEWHRSIQGGDWEALEGEGDRGSVSRVVE